MLFNNSKKKDWYFFIKRTRIAIVLSLIILILGYLSVKRLPQEVYPDISSPVVYVDASYTGASASVMETSVASVIEAGLTGLDNVQYMESNCSDGSYSLSIYFKSGSNKDVNLLNVKNQLQEINFQLPSEVQRNGVSAVTTSSDKGSIMLNLYSKKDKWEQLDLANYARSNIINRLKMVDGVADVVISGMGDYSMRIWLDPQKMAALGITPFEVNAALNEQNAQYVVGTLGAPPLDVPQDIQMTIKADSLLSTPEEFGNVIIKTSGSNGQVLLKDISRIELGSDDYSSFALVGNKNTAIMQIIPNSGANLVQLSNNINETVKQINRWIPRDLSLNVIYDDAIYMKESINEVVTTIIITIVIVSLIILLFLGNVVSTLIPCVAIPISLIGAFIVLYMFGMTINMFTLFALILAVSVVVDDAIVVVENVNRHIADGASAKKATQLTMEEIGITLVTMSLILMAVFFPICFMAGFTGILYKQFAVFLSASIIISAICALTLSPAMSSVLLRRDSDMELFAQGKKGLFSLIFSLFNKFFDKLSGFYTNCVKSLVYSPKLTIIVYTIIVLLMIVGFYVIPKAFVQNEDQGLVVASVQIRDNSTVDKTKAITKKIVRTIGEIEGIDPRKLIIFGNETSASMFIQLKEWQDRNLSILQKIQRRMLKKPHDLSNNAILEEILKRTEKIEGATVNAYVPASLGNDSQGLTINVVSSANYTLEELSGFADKLAEKINENKLFAYAYNTNMGTYPMYIMHIDYKKALAMNVSIESLTSTMSSFIGSSVVSEFTKNGKNYQVVMQADNNFRRDRHDLRRLYVQSGTGAMIPVEAVMYLEEVQSPPVITRLNQNRSVCVIAQNTSKISTGTAMKIMEQYADAILPSGVTYEWTGSSLQEIEATNQTIFVISLALLFIYFFLVALYESWTIPVVILIVSPVSIVGAIIFLLMLGKPFDIYSQIGVITLIGLSAKQSILFVEFAMTQMKASNLSIQSAAILAASMRFRAIAMTELSFLIGVLPMLFAVGPSANSRISLAATVFGGMFTTMTIGAVLTPGFYSILQTYLDRLPKQVEEENYVEEDKDSLINEKEFYY